MTGGSQSLSSQNVWNTILQWKQGVVISRVPDCNSRCCQTFLGSDPVPAPSVPVHQWDESIFVHQFMVGILSGVSSFLPLSTAPDIHNQISCGNITVLPSHFFLQGIFVPFKNSLFFTDPVSCTSSTITSSSSWRNCMSNRFNRDGCLQQDTHSIQRGARGNGSTYRCKTPVFYFKSCTLTFGIRDLVHGSALFSWNNSADSSHFSVRKPNLNPMGVKWGVREDLANNAPGLSSCPLVLLLDDIDQQTVADACPVPSVLCWYHK